MRSAVHKMEGNHSDAVKICSEDSLLEENRHPLKCNRNRQSENRNSTFQYDRFSNYLSTKFHNERQGRKCALNQGNSVHSLNYYTDSILRQELVDIYGPMNESSTKFKLIFENYKEERLAFLENSIEEEQQLFFVKDSRNFENVYPPNLFESIIIQDKFSSTEISLFENISSKTSSQQIDPFVLPRLVKSENYIIKTYIQQNMQLNSLTEFDPEISISNVIVPEICDINVGNILIEKIVEIVNENPTGISNTTFLTQFKKKYNYFPDPKAMNYLSFSDMMHDLGKDIILVQDLPKHDSFYYPMCLQGLISTPQEMFWKIWHKLKIVINLLDGIVKLSKALKCCENLYGWKKLNVQAWGFENDYVFVRFLLDFWGDHDIKVISEMEFKPNGNDNVKYLVLLTEKSSRYFNLYSSRVKEYEEKTSRDLKNKSTLQVQTSTGHPTVSHSQSVQKFKTAMNETTDASINNKPSSSVHENWRSREPIYKPTKEPEVRNFNKGNTPNAQTISKNTNNSNIKEDSSNSDNWRRREPMPHNNIEVKVPPSNNSQLKKEAPNITSNYPSVQESTSNFSHERHEEEGMQNHVQQKRNKNKKKWKPISTKVGSSKTFVPAPSPKSNWSTLFKK